MKVYGIDLGTTNTCISTFVDGKPEMITIDNAPTFPSIVAWDGEQILVGIAAKNYSFLSPQSAVRSIKRKMGQLDFRATLGDRQLSPIDISAEILRYAAHKAEEATGEEVKKVVITVPAWFGDEQRRATMEAGTVAGLDVLRIINEPTAAGLTYQLAHSSNSQPTKEHWLIYDLGGGTFDVSVLQVSGDYKEVLASAGNTFLGGDDFDRLLVQHIVTQVRDRQNLDLNEDEIAMAQIRHQAEQCKIALSTEAEFELKATIQVHQQPVLIDMTIERSEFEEMILDLIESTINKVEQALSDAKLDKSQIDRVILVGGSSRIPLVQEKLRTALNISPEFYVDPDLSVAMGACIQAALVVGLSCQQIVVDICPHTLGIATLGEMDSDPESMIDRDYPLTFAPLIQRNSRLPAKMTRTFYKIAPLQETVEIVVLQGESARTDDNKLIGRFMCPLERNSDLDFHVSFSYDINGIIQISVSQHHGQQQLRQYTMNTNKSVAWNSEEPSIPTDQDLVLDTEASGVDEDQQVSNYLLQKIESELQKFSASEQSEVRAKVSAYREALSEQDDERLDELESQLYDWLEKTESFEVPHGPE
ncbi:MAG: Hsp70 family protein [Oligoflexus sp.]